MRRRKWLAIYLAALAGSGAVRWFGSPLKPPGEMRVAMLRRIRLAYRDSEPESKDGTPVILVHGSPGSSEIFAKLTKLLAPHFRVIAPDLPGFGYSTRGVPDYSFRTHGQYLIELLDALHLRKAHLVGFSMGGGVVLSMADLAPDHAASIVMLSAIGAQEYELLGSYRANHIVHGAQLAALWTLREGLPHFGLLDRLPLNVEYARNFYDSDQRPLRSILMRYAGPMLILHGSGDPLVPVAAARTHHRLVPQSELRVVNGDHFLVFERPETLIQPLETFLRRVNVSAPR